MKILQKNKKLFFDYEVFEDFEAGIVLKGDEVKSIRRGAFSIKEAYCKIDKEKMEIFLYDMTIDKNPYGTHTNIEPKRKRKLLLHKNQIKRLQRKIEEKGLTLKPVEVYLNDRNLVKIKIALCKGKKMYDKKESIKRKDYEREISRDLKNHR
uniref:SsrA-binding protein n=1 Tax=candidate division WOR-3 bacterium TaxID=2052148 RepID=A0A7C3N5Z3_UNCW3